MHSYPSCAMAWVTVDSSVLYGTDVRSPSVKWKELGLSSRADEE